MFKTVRKNIREMTISGDRGVLNAKGFGKFAIWFSAIWGGMMILSGIGFLLSWGDYGQLFAGFGILMIVLGIILIAFTFRIPFYEWFEFDQDAQVFKYYRGTFRTKGDPDRAKGKHFGLNELTINWKLTSRLGSVTILIKAEDGTRFYLTMPYAIQKKLTAWFSQYRSDFQPETSANPPSFEDILLIVEEERNPETPAILEETDRVQENPFKPAYQQMLKDIRIWGWSSSVLGVLHFVVSGVLDPAWGIALFAVGGISFLIREASMYVIYAVVIAWVGLSNVMAGGFGGWTIFGVLQIYWSYQLYRKYRVYAIVEKKYLELEAGQEEPANRAKDTFPGCGFALGLVGLVGAVGVFVLVIAAVAARGPDAPVPENLQVIDFIMGALLASGILGFALSVAALVSKYPRKWLAWIGALAGGLLMVFEIFLRLGAM